MNIDFSAMSVEQLQAHRASLDKSLAEKQAEGKRDAIKEIQAIMAKYDLSVDDLSGRAPSKRQGQPVAPKYRDPSTGATWTGRGKAPKWIEGKDREQFAI